MSLRQSAKAITVIAASLLLLFFVAATPALAFDGRTGDEVVIPADETVEEDLYVAANTVQIDGTVEGDLVAAASVVEVNGVVEGDMMTASRDAIVRGVVQDDARAAGSSFTLAQGAEIGDDVVASGYSLAARPDSSVGGQLLFAGNEALLAGNVAGDVDVSAAALAIRGQIDGDVGASLTGAAMPFAFSPNMFMPQAPQIPSVDAGLTLGEGATVSGDLVYRSDQSFDVPTAAVSGDVEHQMAQATGDAADEAAVGSLGWFFDQAQSFVALLIVGLLLVAIAPRLTDQAATALQERPGASLGWGFVSFIAAGVTFVATLVLVIAAAVGLGWIALDGLAAMVVLLGVLALMALTILFLFAIVYLAKIVVGYLGGRLILAQIGERWANNRLLPLVLGLLILGILAAVPYLGVVVDIAVVLLGLGAIWLLGRDRLSFRMTTDEEGKSELRAGVAGATD